MWLTTSLFVFSTTAHGGKAIVPGDLDLLIAGFCCVDFSTLNNQRKSLDDYGESGDTLKAVLAYAEEFRPKMIILENVKGAPWLDENCKESQTSIARRFEDISYAFAFTMLDT